MLISVEARRRPTFDVCWLTPSSRVLMTRMKQCHKFWALNAFKSVSLSLSQGMTWLRWTHQPLQSQSQKEMSGGKKVSCCLFPEILRTVAAALGSSGVHCSSLADSLLCAFQSVTMRQLIAVLLRGKDCSYCLSTSLSWVMLGEGWCLNWNQTLQ